MSISTPHVCPGVNRHALQCIILVPRDYNAHPHVYMCTLYREKITEVHAAYMLRQSSSEYRVLLRCACIFGGIGSVLHNRRRCLLCNHIFNKFNRNCVHIVRNLSSLESTKPFSNRLFSSFIEYTVYESCEI